MVRSGASARRPALVERLSWAGGSDEERDIVFRQCARAATRALPKSAKSYLGAFESIRRWRPIPTTRAVAALLGLPY